jgi:hypothetical protein
MASSYPNLGFDPCPGDLAGYQALTAYAARSATAVAGAVSTLSSARSQEWRGQAADAFRAHVDSDVLPLARKASESVGRAAGALRMWTLTLAGLQDEARALDRQAAPYRSDLATTLRSAGLPAGSTAPYPATVTRAQKTRLDQANTALAAIMEQADQLHQRYLGSVQQANSQLENAGNLAPQPPGLFSSLWHDATATWDDATHALSEFVHDKALWEFVSGVCNIIATVAGVLALFPPLTAIFGPIALGAALLAMASDAVLAMFDHGSWSAVVLDAVAAVADAGWMRAAGKIADLYEEAGLATDMTKAPTLAAIAAKVPKLGSKISEEARTAKVAPGLFRMIGDSLKEASGGTNATVRELAAIKNLDSYGTWRAIDIVAGQASWSFSAAGIEAIPGNVRTWVNDLAVGKNPWQEPAPSDAGQG